MKIIRLTKEEFEVLVTEVAERMRDMVYMKAEEKAREMLHRVHLDKQIDITAENEYAFIYRVVMVTGDFVQIISRLRRQKEEEPK